MCCRRSKAFPESSEIPEIAPEPMLPDEGADRKKMPGANAKNRMWGRSEGKEQIGEVEKTKGTE